MPDDLTTEVNERTLKVTASITIRKPGSEPYSYTEYFGSFSKEFPSSTSAAEARAEVASEASTFVLDLGREYKAKRDELSSPSAQNNA